MPALPIFFVIMPLQIWFALFLLAVTVAGVIEFHAEYFEETMSGLLEPV